MNRNDYFNTVTLQVESLFELVEVQAERCFDIVKLNAILTPAEFAALESVVLSGCGDSFSAAGAMRATFSELSGIGKTYAPDPMEFTRFWADEEINKDGSPKALVVAISASGSADRIVEILQRGKAAKAKTMLISNNPESKGAKAAELFYHVDTPVLCNTPGLRSYFASMVALVALGGHIGVCKGKLSLQDFENLKQSVVDYVKGCQASFEEMNGKTFELSKTWKDFSRFEVIGDGPYYFSAQFVEEKFIECPGAHCSHVDSEDWCHINIFLKEPKTLGTIIHAFKSAPSFNRLIETANSAASIGRPVLVVTDQPDAGFDEKITVCSLPTPPEGLGWLSLLVDFAPGSLMSGYAAAVADKNFFCGRYDFRAQKWL